MAENKNENRTEGKGSMTVEEAGRKGGEKVAAERGSEFYSEIGQKGGQRVRDLVEKGEQSEQEEEGGESESGKKK